MHGIFLAGVAWFLLTGSAPNGFVSDVYTFLMYVFVRSSLIAWGLFLLVHLAARATLVWLRTSRPRWSRAWLIVPTALACFWFVHQSGVVWWARWYVSRGAFQRLALMPASERRPGLYGLFYITEIKPGPSQSTVFRVGFPDLYSDWFPHFALANGPWPNLGVPCFEWLDGGWWFLWDNT